MDEWKFEPARDLGLSPQERLRSLRRENGLLEASASAAWWGLIGAYLALVHRLNVRGREHLPRRAPFILVANHSSHLDVLALAAAVPWRLRERLFPIAAGDTFFEKVPVAMFAAFALNALPLWRKKCSPADMDALRRRLMEEPCAYVLFPEGTRSRTGQMARFRRGIGVLVAGTVVPVVPCRLEGAFEAFPPHRRFPVPGRITLSVGEPLSFHSERNDPEGWARIAARLEETVRGMAAP